jgi:membrane-bound metal-dependent hydrolase YbcI (DUF457 family)
MKRCFTRDRILHSLVNAVTFFVIILLAGLLLSKAPVGQALAYAVVVGAIVFLWRVVTRTDRSTPPFRFPGMGAS